MKKELVSKIKEYSKAYYTGNRLISDQQFDFLVEELRSVDPDNTILKTPGWGYVPERNKVKHKFGLVGSLEKIHSLEECKYNHKIITPKFDGSSVTVEYNNGVLVQALSRGNGTIGVDITHHVIQIVPNQIPDKSNRCFRGECVIPISVFEKYKDLYDNPRNMVPGVLNSLSINLIVKDFKIIFYSELTDKSYNKASELEYIKSQGLDTAEFTYQNSSSIEGIEEWVNSFGILVDGAVITENLTGESLALKFKDETAEVTIESVDWQTGSSGRIIPVCNFSPVRLDGATLTRATLHCAEFAKLNGVDKGAVIEIIRANQVIPYVQKVLSPVESVIPDECPACKSKTKWEGAHLMCSNDNCPNKAITAIFRLFEVAGIPEGLSETIINYVVDVVGGRESIHIIGYLLLFKQSGPKTIPSRHNYLMNKFGLHYGTLLWKLECNLEKLLKTGMTYSQFWRILNLDTLSYATADKLKKVNPIKLRSLIKEGKAEKVKAILSKTRVNYRVVESIILDAEEYWFKVLYIIDYIKPDLKLKVGDKFKGIVYCITGIRDKDLQGSLIRNGAIEKGSVTKDTNLVIAKDPKSSSGKAQEARNKNIELISHEEAIKRFM